jgi:hypothetical protein
MVHLYPGPCHAERLAVAPHLHPGVPSSRLAEHLLRDGFEVGRCRLTR